MSNLRIATLDDIELLVRVTGEFLTQTPYRNMTPDEAQRTAWLSYIMDTGVILLADEDSFIGGVTVQLPFSTDVVAAELLWGSLKKGLQRPKVELELLEAFEYWGRQVAKANAVQIGRFHSGKFLERRGYTKCETMHMVRF